MSILGEYCIISNEISLTGTIILPNVTVKANQKSGTILMS